MLRLTLPLAALTAGLGLYVANAQPPEGRPGQGEKQPRAEGQPRGEGRPMPRGPRVDPQVEAWVKILVEKITDPHDEIRDSARAALVAVGRPALATLTPLANGTDGAKATAATKLVEAIEKANPRTAPVAGGPVNQLRSEQPRPGNPMPGQPGVNPFEAIVDDLGLNDKQRKQVEDIHEALRRKNDELREQVNDGKLDREEAHEKRKIMHEDMFKAMKSLLSEEQFKKFQESFRNAARPPRPDGERRPE